jgi:hypothetical protein
MTADSCMRPSSVAFASGALLTGTRWSIQCESQARARCLNPRGRSELRRRTQRLPPGCAVPGSPSSPWTPDSRQRLRLDTVTVGTLGLVEDVLQGLQLRQRPRPGWRRRPGPSRGRSTRLLPISSTPPTCDTTRVGPADSTPGTAAAGASQPEGAPQPHYVNGEQVAPLRS